MRYYTGNDSPTVMSNEDCLHSSTRFQLNDFDQMVELLLQGYKKCVHSFWGGQ